MIIEINNDEATVLCQVILDRIKELDSILTSNDLSQVMRVNNHKESYRLRMMLTRIYEKRPLRTYDTHPLYVLCDECGGGFAPHLTVSTEDGCSCIHCFNN